MDPYTLIPLISFLALVLVGGYAYGMRKSTFAPRALFACALFGALWGLLDSGFGMSAPTAVATAAAATLGLGWFLTGRGLLQATPPAAVGDITAIMPDCFILAGPDDEILRVNRATLELGGFREEELVGRRLDELFDEQTVRALASMGEHPDRPLDLEATFRTARDERIPLRLRAGRCGAKAGGPRGRVLIGHDLRERKQTEETLRKAERLASLELIAVSVAHDINNLLGSIAGRLTSKETTEEGKAQRIETAVSACFAGVSFTRQLADFAGDKGPRLEICSIQSIVQHAVALTTRGTGLQAELSLGEDIPPIEADRHQMLQVLMNLLINARQAQPDHGKIRVSVRTVASGQQSPAAASLVEVRIEDWGAGIPEDILPHVFEPFYTTKSRGTGLGLAIARSIVQRHGGTIALSSTAGMGTTCIVRLPSCRQEHAVEDRTPPLPRRGRRILVMDDNELVRTALADMLEDMGLEVEQARNGGEAIELYLSAQTRNREFDALIVDLTVSGGEGGAQAMTRLRRIDPGVKVIVASGHHYDEVMLNYRDHGFVGAIVKPFTRGEIGRLLAEVLETDRDDEEDMSPALAFAARDDTPDATGGEVPETCQSKER